MPLLEYFKLQGELTYNFKSFVLNVLATLKQNVYLLVFHRKDKSPK